jgi:hypothetical protein
MTQNSTATGGTLNHRTSASRKLLARKAVAQAQAVHGDTLEDVFPSPSEEGQGFGAPANASSPASPPDEVQASTPTTQPLGADTTPLADADNAPLEGVTAELPQPSAAQAVWSDEDERAFAAMTARRKAAGFQRRGKDVGGQLLRVGDIAPNAGTVVATIVGLVAERGTVARAELLGLIGSTTFGNSKARPEDRGWCQGYVQGAVRDGFLAVAVDDSVGEASHASATVPEVMR